MNWCMNFHQGLLRKYRYIDLKAPDMGIDDSGKEINLP